MRVLHVVDSRQLRGGEIFASDLIRALNLAGVTQRVALLQGGDANGVRYDAPEHVLGSNGWRIPGLRMNTDVLRALRTLIRDWRPDTVQGHGGSSLKYSIPAAAGRRTSIVYRQIGQAPTQARRALRRAAYRRLMRRTTRMVAVAEVVRREMIDVFGIPPSRVVTIPNAVDVSRMRSTTNREVTREALGIGAEEQVIVSLGALSWEKDPLTHLEVAGRVLRDRPGVKHVIVGDGPMRRDIEESIRHRGLQGRIVLLGARRDIPDILAASDLVLFASRPDGMEGMPASVIEAGMMGVPVAAFAVAGVPEVVIDRVTGRLTPVGDVGGLTAAVLELLGNPEVVESMGKTARDWCRSRFDIATIAPRYLDLYEELVAA